MSGADMMGHAGVLDDVSRETRDRLTAYADLLVRWNARINLVSRPDLAQLWPRHIADSLQLAALIPQGARVVDMGSGGGFPGLVIAMATDAHVTLIESDQRKAAFLREASRVAGVRTRVIAARIEAAEAGPADIVTARALAPLPQLLQWGVRFLDKEGFCLFLKGKNADEELNAANADWRMAVTRIPSRTDADGIILRLSDIRRVTDHNHASSGR
ncbi:MULTISPECIES: 16S rRNA (guanine(527)-N(7))-methyltransferase RsmG [Novacetimonas]|uniref:Ribosomal RNA small subunit methyltransferase G n=4 Tax=Novacetimonas hansenii TaxID=436 RepID=A0AAW5EU70_NOVHA|nr:16S rRNA (guanine(527)-N(7))-methyltransferase RsmG [Novacetimonas hansenii]EFG85826.1 putative methyltransferase gidB (glucose-inhibited divisio protein B) [Novacetimonas hansenii ATCC 23769]MCJ8354342.1 16S rRNA (guanine(527)-N(7))-methyltransferase RsmG [Novacetimonas hansenii]GAN82400.1 glucose inhibited division protein B methyltransferase GidB [Novacetimonas hansenii JCM 7643]GEC62187.1 ribosomal RNA small subunit methyltransferase G [Novacetimonas hansenii]